MHRRRDVDEEPNPRPAIRVAGMTRHFGAVTAVNDVTFDVAPGTILGLIGPSGSGKTSSIRMMTGTLRPSAGRVEVLGEEPMRFSRHTRERIAYMPQLISLYPDLSARENVGFVAALYGIGWVGRRRLIRNALEVVDLWDVRNRVARDLSGGMQRRLELACALVHEPEVLFVDEPTAGIDPMLRRSIWDELRRLRDAGRTLLVSTQYVGEAEYCDRVALLADGELVALDTPGLLRRLVFGGDLIEVVARRTVDPTALAGVPGVLRVRQTQPRHLVVVTEDAGITTPLLVDALRGADVDIEEVAEYQPSFDEVFASLVEQRRARKRDPREADAATDAA